MNNELHFNMTMLSKRLLYACCFFADHVQQGGRPFSDEEVLDWLKHRFLFWFEITVGMGLNPIRFLEPLCDLLNPEVKPILDDTITFVRMIGDPASIYIVALPLMRPSSFLF